MSKLTDGFTVYLPDSRGVQLARYGIGNLKIGLGVYTYSRLAGRSTGETPTTCPGATDECERICYAKRIDGPVKAIYLQNSITDEVPPIPAECKLLRIHVSGDFDSVNYIHNWYLRLKERPDVRAWAYTRSWRVPELLSLLEHLRALPNMQLFASMDESCPDEPPAGWRRAWIDGDVRAGLIQVTRAHEDGNIQRNIATFDGTMSLVCPEETKHKANCVECGYCFDGQRNDVTFLRH